MKHFAQVFALLLISFVAAPLFAMERNVVDDVIRMTRAGVAEDAIVEFVHKSDVRTAVSADDMIAMTDAKVSRFVIKALLDEADRTGASRDDRRTVERETVVVSPSYVAPYYYPYYRSYYPYYDPFWYGPSLSLNFGFGGYGSRGGYYRGGHDGGGYGGGHGGGGRGGHH